MQGHFIRIIEKKMECKYKTLFFSMSGLAANSAWQKKKKKDFFMSVYLAL